MSALGTSHISQTLLWLHLTKGKEEGGAGGFGWQNKNCQTHSKFHIIFSEFCVATSFNVPKIAPPKGEWEQSSSPDLFSAIGAQLPSSVASCILKTWRKKAQQQIVCALCSLKAERVKIKACLLCGSVCGGLERGRGVCEQHIQVALQGQTGARWKGETGHSVLWRMIVRYNSALEVNKRGWFSME